MTFMMITTVIIADDSDNEGDYSDNNDYDEDDSHKDDRDNEDDDRDRGPQWRATPSSFTDE